MGLRVLLRKQITPSSRRAIRRDPHEITDGDRLFPVYLLIMMPNTVRTIAKSYRLGDYQSALLGVYVLVGVVLLQWCLSKCRSLPKDDKSGVKFCLKFTMWFLYTTISFGFVHQFTYFFSLQTAVSLYAAEMICSALLFYALVVHDHVRDLKIRSRDEDEFKNQTLDAGKWNHSESAWEKA